MNTNNTEENTKAQRCVGTAIVYLISIRGSTHTTRICGISATTAFASSVKSASRFSSGFAIMAALSEA